VNAQTQRIEIAGPVGVLEALRDLPAPGAVDQVRGVAVIAHPHPLFGGTMDNKVVQTLARAFVQSGWCAVRFNFRGVGGSAGVYDAGRGELADLLAVVADQAGDSALALAGFSFGAFVASHAVAALSAQRALGPVVLVGTAVSRFDASPIPAELHDQILGVAR